ncbi:MAG: flagellar basal body L-ring protein FlgH [Sphingomonadales bacterium]
MRTINTAIILLGLAVILPACGTLDRIAHIGRAPDLTPIGKVEVAPQQRSISLPVNVQNPAMAATMPQNIAVAQPDTSLWRTGARAFFSDPRANKVGDLLTVNINIADNANVDNTTTRSRTSSDEAGITNFLGFESNFGSFLPDAVNPSSLVDADSTTSTTGNGQVVRSEAVNLTVAAIVTQVLPNGNLVIQGRQEVRVNFEVRELIVAGIVRPQDITDDNTIPHTQMAEARISYGGRGQLTDMQQARYGQQLLDILFPY